MGFLDWIGKSLTQIGKTINEKIASFEKATGIDIPLVGAKKEEISKPSTPTTAEQIEQAKTYLETGKIVSPFQPQEQMSVAPKTYRVELGTQAYQEQIEEVKEQVGGGKVVATPEGKIAVEFESTSPPKEIKVTPYEEITKQREQERLKEQVSQVYEKASPLEKLGLHAHTFFSEKGLEYIWSYLPGGKTPEQVVKEKMVESVKTPQVEYVKQTIIGSLFGSPPGIVGTSTLFGTGIGAAVGKAAPSAALKVGQAMAKHPTATKVATGLLIGGIELGSGVITYKTLEAQGVPKEEIAEEIGAEISRDVLGLIGFGYGLKYGLEKTLPKQQQYLLGSRTQEKTVKLTIGKEEGIPEGKIAVKIVRSEVYPESIPVKEMNIQEVIRKGKIIEKTPDYIIKEYKGQEFLISKTPMGLPTQKLEGKDLIDVLRVEKAGYLKLGVVKEGKYAGMEVFVRKGGKIPVTFEMPLEEEFKPTVIKPSGKPRPVLKELAESYKASKLAEDMKLAEKIAGTETQQMRHIEEATKNILGIEPGKEGVKVSSGGMKLITETKPTGFVRLEPIVSPVALEIPVEPTVPLITPALITPTLTPRIQTVKPKTVSKETLKVEKVEKEVMIPTPTKVQTQKPTEISTTPVIFTPEIYEPRITTPVMFPPKQVPRITTPEEFIPTEILTPVTPPKITTPPTLFPELPKGSLGKIALEDEKMLKQMTKYEPSLLGILLGKKRKGKQKLFTGFEIRGL